MTRPDKITPENIKQHINDSAVKHNGYGWKMFISCYTLGINVANMAKLFNVNPRTMAKYKEVEKLRRQLDAVEDDKAVEQLRD